MMQYPEWVHATRLTFHCEKWKVQLCIFMNVTFL